MSLFYNRSQNLSLIFARTGYAGEDEWLIFMLSCVTDNQNIKTRNS